MGVFPSCSHGSAMEIGRFGRLPLHVSYTMITSAINNQSHSLPASTDTISRASLLDGSAMAAIRALAPPEMVFRTEEELESSITDTLALWTGTDDIYVFAYGSLMWNPAVHYEEALQATIKGWSRKFCLWMYLARGSVAWPGLMLALDRGGSCRGMLFRISAGKVRDELSLLWRREMLSDAYEARWVNAFMRNDSTKAVRALTFVINRKNTRYTRSLTDDQVAHYITTGKGNLGTSATYFESTVNALHNMGIVDASIERVRSAIARLASSPGQVEI